MSFKTHAKERATFSAMKQRCNNKHNRAYPNYGGRGIRVEYELFDDFFADVGPAPSPAHSIDRINNDGNYAKGNCRWATDEEQANNSRKNRVITHNGKTQTLAQWVKENEMSYDAVSWRLQHGWSIEEALFSKEKDTTYIEYENQSLTADQWEKITGIHRNTLRYRLKQGWSLDRVFGKKRTFPRNTEGRFLKQSKI